MFDDRTRLVTLTYAGGKTYQFKAKERKPITEESIMTDPVVMAIYKKGKLVKPTNKDIMGHRLLMLDKARELGIIK